MAESRILLTHTPEMRRNYYGDRALAGLRELGTVLLHEADEPLDAAGLVRPLSPQFSFQNPVRQRSRDIHAWDGHSSRHSRAHSRDRHSHWYQSRRQDCRSGR